MDGNQFSTSYLDCFALRLAKNVVRTSFAGRRATRGATRKRFRAENHARLFPRSDHSGALPEGRQRRGSPQEQVELPGESPGATIVQRAPQSRAWGDERSRSAAALPGA